MKWLKNLFSWDRRAANKAVYYVGDNYDLFKKAVGEENAYKYTSGELKVSVNPSPKYYVFPEYSVYINDIKVLTFSTDTVIPVVTWEDVGRRTPEVNRIVREALEQLSHEMYLASPTVALDKKMSAVFKEDS